jgi:hypothetical protein
MVRALVSYRLSYEIGLLIAGAKYPGVFTTGISKAIHNFESRFVK